MEEVKCLKSSKDKFGTREFFTGGIDCGFGKMNFIHR